VGYCMLYAFLYKTIFFQKGLPTNTVRTANNKGWTFKEQ
jgi:hypothetical protein